MRLIIVRTDASIVTTFEDELTCMSHMCNQPPTGTLLC
jgi:hypothetical protein